MHPFLAERIISMLNYFLQHLVGPKMGALKVKDFSEFDFKPQQLVSDICTIYLNLGYGVATPLAQTTRDRSFFFRVTVSWVFLVVFSALDSDEENFCATVPKDGRSYSPTLFSQTVRVLKKINKPGDMIVAFGFLADKIKVSLFDIDKKKILNLSAFTQQCVIVCSQTPLLWCFCFSPMLTDSSRKRRLI